MIEKLMYEHAYDSFTPDFISKENLSKINSLLRENTDSLRRYLDQFREQFSHQYHWQQMNALELGSGLGSMADYLDQHFSSYHGVDFSSLAIANAKLISDFAGKSFDYSLVDVTKDDSLGKQFEFIVDSHLLHCLVTQKQRQGYFTFVKNHLAPNGVFLGETMAFHAGVQFPFEYEFQEDYSLWKNVNGNVLPIRKISPSQLLERELQESGLKIHTYFYHNELCFNLFPEYPDFDPERLPKLIRFSLVHL